MRIAIYFHQALILFLFCGQLSFSQFVLNSSYNPVAGDTLKSKSVDTAGIYPGPGGENQTWNFSGAVILSELSNEIYLVPSSTPYYNLFPNSNAASINSNIPPVYHYYMNVDSGSYVLGYVQSPAVLRYYDPLPRMLYPISYSTQLNKTYYGVSNWGSTTMHFNGTRSFTGDGYGTIILPIGTFNNVLRIKIIDEVYDTTFSGGIVVGTSHEIVTYHQWYRPGYKFPVFSIVEVIPSQNQPWKVAVIEQSNVPIGIKQLSSEIPVQHRLFQNYPNPFNSHTKIRFDISKKTSVNIIVYDVKGSKIDVLLNDTIQAGSYAIDWNAGSLASGIYYYRLVSEEYSSTRKMVLLK